MGSSTVSTSTIAATLKPTLDSIVDDDMVGSPSVMQAFLIQKSMSDAYEDDQEFGGPGLASVRPEGSVTVLGGMRQGVTTRYLATEFGLRMNITRVAQEDGKYKEAIALGKRLKRSMVKTKEYEAALFLSRATDSNYPIGDGLSLANSAHTLPDGGTFSNTMATPVTPSETAVIVARAQARAMPGHDGLRGDGPILEKVVCPVEQEGEWEKLIYSKNAPAAGEYNAINVVNQRMSLQLVVNPFWNTTTSNYCFVTDNENGMQFRTRRKDTSKTWVVEDNDTIAYAITGRWAIGCSDARGLLFVNA